MWGCEVCVVAGAEKNLSLSLSLSRTQNQNQNPSRKPDLKLHQRRGCGGCGG